MIDKVLVEITTKGSVYDEIIDNIITPNFHLKPELISELAIGFLENRNKVNNVIEQGYFLYYFIRSIKNQIHSKTSGFYRVTRIKENVPIDNISIIDDGDLERKKEIEELYKIIDTCYVRIPKSYFQDFLWHEYFTLNKTHRQIGTENDISHVLSFHEIKKLKERLIEKIMGTI